MYIELMFDEEYGPAVDVFSFGMVLLEVIHFQSLEMILHTGYVSKGD